VSGRAVSGAGTCSPATPPTAWPPGPARTGKPGNDKDRPVARSCAAGSPGPLPRGDVLSGLRRAAPLVRSRASRRGHRDASPAGGPVAGDPSAGAASRKAGVWDSRLGPGLRCPGPRPGSVPHCVPGPGPSCLELGRCRREKNCLPDLLSRRASAQRLAGFGSLVPAVARVVPAPTLIGWLPLIPLGGKLAATASTRRASSNPPFPPRPPAGAGASPGLRR